MQVVTRNRVDASETSSVMRTAQSVSAVLGNCTCRRSGHVGHAVDDPTLWVGAGECDDVGCHRRALSALEVKMSVRSLLGEALDEQTAFEPLSDLGGTGSALAGWADVGGVGEASVPGIAMGFDRR
jgi:hypothetical protein